MPPASKSAVGLAFDNGGARGDVASHLWRIDTRPVPRDSMFTLDGAFVRSGPGSRVALTLDFACLGCHTDADETLEWASTYARNIHQSLVTRIEPGTAAGERLRLLEAYPNPFRTTVHVPFRLDRDARVRLELYDLTGRLIHTLVDEPRRAGRHTATWRAAEARASGMLVVRLTVDGQTQTGTVLLVR